MSLCTSVGLPKIRGDFNALEHKIFASINALIEPQVLAGWGAPGLVPAGVIVLETTGRVSGAVRRVPVIAARFQESLLVATFRGRRSQWIRNVAATPQLRYWSGGAPRHARAFVFDGASAPPRQLRWLQLALAPSVALGWAFALLTPAAAPRTRAATSRRPSKAPRAEKRRDKPAQRRRKRSVRSR